MVTAGIVVLALGFALGITVAIFNSYAAGTVAGRYLKYCPMCRCLYCRQAKKRDNSEPFSLD